MDFEIQELPEETSLHRVLKNHYLSDKAIYEFDGFFSAAFDTERNNTATATTPTKALTTCKINSNGLITHLPSSHCPDTDRHR